MNGHSLDVRDITVRFGGLTALDSVSLTAPDRQVTGIIGPNGAGKTTLLNVLCGFVRPRSGSAVFDGRDLTRLRAHQLARLGIGRTLQGVGLCHGLTVLENVMIGATPASRAGFWSGFLALPRSDSDEKRLRQRALGALERVEAAGHADAMPDALAHGPRKRVALARALVSEPRLLLLDEPASGLDENELPGLGELIAQLAADTTVVVIEHRMDLVMAICARIHVLDFGKLLSSGTPDEVRADPRVTVAYLGEDRATPGAPADDSPGDSPGDSRGDSRGDSPGAGQAGRG